MLVDSSGSMKPLASPTATQFLLQNLRRRPIAQRFELPQQQLLRMNPQIHDFGETVYIGDVINLDWTTTG
jgi:hypothetical protein